MQLLNSTLQFGVLVKLPCPLELPVHIQHFGSPLELPVRIQQFGFPLELPVRIQQFGSPLELPVHIQLFGSPLELLLQFGSSLELVQIHVPVHLQFGPLELVGCLLIRFVTL